MALSFPELPFMFEGREREGKVRAENRERRHGGGRGGVCPVPFATSTINIACVS